jgi:NADPH:quinone reductase-like Zn-dependent oxidoreductase
MKAMMWTAYGGPNVLQLGEVPTPAPKAYEVLIKVRAATVTLGDCEMRSMTVPSWVRWPLRAYLGLHKPARITILGQELAGEIESVGERVTRFKEGDAVFAPTFFRFGAYAEYACVPEKNVLRKPAGMTFGEAATLPTGGINGLHFLRASKVQAGQQILINGAGGSIGTYAVQIAKSLRAEVTAVDSAEKLGMLRSIGADHVIDYAQEDFTKNGERYDAIIDVVGKSPFSASITSLKQNGRYVLGNPSLSGMLRGKWTSMTSSKKVSFDQASYRSEDYAFLIGLIDAGKVKPVMDRAYALDQTAEAHRYVEAGHKKGNVVICIEQAASKEKRV